jgi:hypothetical protein
VARTLESSRSVPKPLARGLARGENAGRQGRPRRLGACQIPLTRGSARGENAGRRGRPRRPGRVPNTSYSRLGARGERRPARTPASSRAVPNTSYSRLGARGERRPAGPPPRPGCLPNTSYSRLGARGERRPASTPASSRAVLKPKNPLLAAWREGEATVGWRGVREIRGGVYRAEPRAPIRMARADFLQVAFSGCTERSRGHPYGWEKACVPATQPSPPPAPATRSSSLQQAAPATRSSNPL